MSSSRSASGWAILAAGMLLAAGAVRAQAAGQDRGLAAALGGGWTRNGACDHPVHFQLAGNTLRVVGTDGKVDTQRVLERRAAGLATETTASAHGNPIGMRWVYEVLAPGQLSLTDAAGRSADFQRCRNPIPATATPAGFLRGLFAIYVDDADAYLPFASDAGLHDFLMPDLADQISRDADRMKQSGRADGACLTVDPIVGSSVDYKVTAVDVAIAKPHPDMPDRVGGTVSFRNMGEPRRVAFDLRWTPAGWRIDDLRVGTTPSLRAQMAPCAAVAK